MRVSMVHVVCCLLYIPSDITFNAKKYPAELVWGSILKYTQYTLVAGYGEKHEETLDEAMGTNIVSYMDNTLNMVRSVTAFVDECNWTNIVSYMDNTLNMVRRVTAFVDECNWAKFETTMNISLALIGKIGELGALLSFWSTIIRDRTSDETIHTKALHGKVPNVDIYLFHLSAI